MNGHSPSHTDQLERLRKIEGQIHGIQSMIKEGRYCVDILTQLSAVIGAIMRVEENILTRHLESCVSYSFSKGRRRDKEEKMKEIIELLRRFRKH